jgi:hypothetical protein
LIINFSEKYNSNNGYWALCNLLKGPSAINPGFFQRGIAVLIQKICSDPETEQQKEVREECLYSLYEITENDDNILELIQKEELLGQLLPLLL